MAAVLSASPRTKPGLLAVPFYFQTGPLEMFGYDTTTNWTDYSTLGGHQFSRGVDRGLTAYQFDTIFTDYLMRDDLPVALQAYVANLTALGLPPSSLDGISSHPFFALPSERLRQLRVIQDAMTPVVLTMGDTSVLRAPAAGGAVVGGHDLSVEVTLRVVHSEERHGETDAIYAQVQATQFGVPSLGTTTKRGGAKGAEGGDAKLTIKSLDSARCTVSRLAKHYYGDASKTAVIYQRNKPWLSEFTKDENLRAIAAGTVTQTTRMKRLKALLAKHPQIIIPVLTKPAATTRVATTTYVGAS